MTWGRRAFLLNLYRLEYTLGVCYHRAILAPDYFEWSTTYITVVGFGNEMNDRKMSTFRDNCSDYFSRYPTRLLGD